MKASELRLGNWVHQGDNFAMYVVGIFDDEIYLDFPGNDGGMWQCKIEDVYPVELNEDWLKDSGFKPIMGNEFAKWLDEWEGRLIYIDSNFRFYGIEENGSILFTSGNNFKNVHQLQNLYHALTGKEL